MRHAKHSTPVRVAQVALALLAALVASSAAGQAGVRPTQGAQQGTPAAAGPSYGPVLHPQARTSESGAQPDLTPQAQEEKAGAQPRNQHQEVDPSARPAPQPSKKQAARTPRRSVQQRIARVPEVAPSRPLPLAAPPSAQLPAQPVPAAAGPVQINSCLGGTCTDTTGGTYNTGVGNAAVNSAGRLCTRSGNTMQCF